MAGEPKGQKLILHRSIAERAAQMGSSFFRS